MWKPKEGKTYRCEHTDREFTITETPNTAGEPTHIAERLNVRYIDGDGNEGMRDVDWWNRRRNSMEVV